MLMALAGLQALIFTIGVLRKSYFAIALPVLGATMAASGLLFWIGYTMVNMEPDLTELDLEEDDAGMQASA
ncbi:MAG: hypothetical protein WD939_06110 [Dehalococcoidia bacterium]